METFLPKKSEIKRIWYEVDAQQFPLGRLASKIAFILRGKHKPGFTPHLDCGDWVVVVNANKVKVTGRKLIQKEYFRISGYPGGLKRRRLKEVLEKSPERVIIHAVSGMLPPNKLRKSILKRLKVVLGDKHNYKIDKKISGEH